VYGTIPMDAVSRVTPLPVNEGGHSFPEWFQG